MKKMMIIAVMIGALLMPAQSIAQNRRMEKGERKVQIDKKRNNNKKEVNKGGKNFNTKKNGEHKKHIGKNHINHSKPRPIVSHKHKHHPVVAPRPVVIHKPAPRPVVISHNCNVPVYSSVHHPVVHHHCDNNVVEAAAIVLGVAGIISMLSN